MVEFSVFNELSLPFQNNIDIEKKFIDFFKVLKELENRNLTKIRMDNNFKNYFILKDVTFQKFFGQLHDSEMKDKLREFITNGVIKIESPLIKDEEIENNAEAIENEYFYNSQSTFGGLACSDIWNTLTISFNSSNEWDTDIIILQKNEIDISINHASQENHLKTHKNFFKELEEEKKLGITENNFWERREEFFPKKIIFCKEIKKQINGLDKNIFQQAMSILRDVESSKKNITDYNHSPESTSVCNDKKLRKMRIFTYKKIKIQFDEHLKSLPNANRMYFLEHKKKIYIGYIGKHLPL